MIEEEEEEENDKVTKIGAISPKSRQRANWC